jgi:hypothetical protein
MVFKDAKLVGGPCDGDIVSLIIVYKGGAVLRYTADGKGPYLYHHEEGTDLFHYKGEPRDAD